MGGEDELIALTETPAKAVVPLSAFFRLYDSKSLVGLFSQSLGASAISQSRMGREELMRALKGVLDSVGGAEQAEVTLLDGTTCTVAELKKALKYAKEV